MTQHDLTGATVISALFRLALKALRWGFTVGLIALPGMIYLFDLIPESEKSLGLGALVFYALLFCSLVLRRYW